MKKVISTCLLVALVSGCAHPGSSMDTNRIGKQKVNLIEITPSVLANQKSRDRMQLAQKPIHDLVAGQGQYEYRVGPQDILNITVWDHPELTIPAGEFRTAEAAGHLVAEDGTIFYPFVGKIKVAGLTVAEIREKLTAGISDQIRNPQLDVRVAAYRSQRVYVVGEVTNPGVQPVTDIALTVLEAIGHAGDVTADSDMTNVTLTRGSATYDVDLVAMYEYGDLSQNVVLQDGDILSIPDRNLQKVFVLGAVSEPQTQLMHKGRLTLAEALSDAGGVSEETADASEVYVVRGTDTGPQIYRLNARSPGALVLADQFNLVARDIVYVETSSEIRLAERLIRLGALSEVLRDFSGTDFPLFDGRGDGLSSN